VDLAPAVDAFNFLVGVSTIVAAVMAALAVVVALGAGTSSYQYTRLLDLRWRYLGPELRRQQPRRWLTEIQFRFRFVTVTRCVITRRPDSANDRVVDELNWIGKLLGKTALNSNTGTPSMSHTQSVSSGSLMTLINSYLEVSPGDTLDTRQGPT
jgi:hypothetical protein